MTAAIEVTDLVVRYGKGRKATKEPPAVDGVSFHINAGETLGLVGESGSGKSTIGKALIGLQPATSGTVLLHGKDVTAASLKERSSVASELRVVFQDPYSSLNPDRTIGQTLAEPLSTIGVRGDEARKRSIAALESVGIPGGWTCRYPSQLSGGQRQRVAIARGLVCDPNVIVLDEPVSALDLSTQAQVLNLLADLRDERGLAFLFIAHDLGVVRFLGRERESLGIGSASAAPPDPSGCPFASRCPLVETRCHTERPLLRQVGNSLTACHRAEEVGISWPPSAAVSQDADRQPPLLALQEESCNRAAFTRGELQQ